MPDNKSNIAYLPIEISNQLISLLDRETAICLALSCKAFFHATQDRIWKELDLDIHPCYGEYPSIPRNLQEEGDPEDSQEEGEKFSYMEWLNNERRYAERRRREALRKRIGRMMKEANTRQLGLMERVRMVPRPGAVNSMMALLELVSPNLLELEILAPPEDQVCPQDLRDLWEIKWFDWRITFSALTYLRLGPSSYHLCDLFPFICVQCPSLLKLDVTHQQYNLYTIPRDIEPETPLIEEETRIEEVRISFVNPNEEQSDYWPNLHLFMPMEWSPQLRKLSLDYREPVDRSAEDGLWFEETCGTLNSRKYLQDLEWAISPEYFCDVLEAGEEYPDEDTFEDALPELRRLVLHSEERLDIIDLSVRLPKLETYCLIGVKNPIPKTRSSGEPLHHHMSVTLIKTLNLMPNLHNLHSFPEHDMMGNPDIFARLDAVKATGNYTGHVRSYHHEGHILLHLLPNMQKDGGYQVRYREYTVYKGLCVPLAVISAMQLAERKSDKDWRRRGVEVGNEGWKPLLEWYEAEVRTHSG